MIQIKLIPDGGAKLPAEARDHAVLSSKLENTDPTETPAPSWREIRRVVSGRGEYLILRIPNSTLDDYAADALDSFATNVANINGLKKHPDGWTEQP